MYYHYTSLETLLKILQNIDMQNGVPMLQLYARRIDKVNDPTEVLVTKRTLLALVKNYEERNDVPKDNRIAHKIESLSQKAISDATKLEKMEHPLYITCFSKKKDYNPMWALYGDKHHGVCLCFSDDIKYRRVVKDNDNAIIISGDVAYRRLKDSESVNNCLKVHYMFPSTKQEELESVVSDILSYISPFIKNNNYSYEREFRLCVYNYISKQIEERWKKENGTFYENTKDNIKLNIPVSSLKRIILGKKVPDIMKNLLRNYINAQQYGIDIKHSKVPFQ